MRETTCPSSELLADYALGRVSTETLEQVAIHVDQCPACQSRLEALDSVDDTFVSKLKQSRLSGSDSQDSELEVLIAQVEGISRDAEAARDEAASAGQPATPGTGIRLPITLGQYELLARLGRGGMGTVYKARHLRLKRFVAVKVISQQRLPDPQAVARFHREMEAVGRLSHPNIVQATDAGETAGQHFLAMEFVEGRNLAQLVRAGGPLPVADACEIARQAAVGLEHAHGQGLVHRDVKPSNLMLTSDGTVKVLDLGLARLLDSPGDHAEATGSQQILGSPDFMAPEQAQDSRQVDARTDLYSLGCTLYYLLAAQPPFAGPQYDSRLKKVLAHAQAQPTPIHELRPEVSASLSDLLTKLLAKNPSDRPGSAAEVVRMLGPLAVGHDLPALIRARPVPETDQESSLEAGRFDAALPVAPTRAPSPAALLFRRAWPVLVVDAVVVMVLAWKFWPHATGIDTGPPAASKEQGPSSVPSAVTTTGEDSPTPPNPAMGRLFFKGTPEGAVLRITGGPRGPILVDMDKQRSIRLPPGDYRIKIERETKPHTVLQEHVMLEEGEQATVVVAPAVPVPPSFKKLHDDLLERTRALQRQQAEENRRRAETHAPSSTSP
jgi:serine/threonine protein kinase